MFRDINAQDADPGLRHRCTRRCRNLRTFRQHGVRTLCITSLEHHRAEQPQQACPQLLIRGPLSERAFQPVPSLGQQPAGQPEAPQRASQPRPDLVAVGQGPFQRDPEIVKFLGQRCWPAYSLSQAQERGRVPVPGRVGAADLGEPVRSVVADGIQQPVAGPVLGRLGGHQRLAGQPVDHLQRRHLVAAAHLGRLR
jgi:hypothetical protein